MLSKRSAYRRDFDETKYMSFLINDDALLKKYDEIWGKISSKPIYNQKYLKNKIKC